MRCALTTLFLIFALPTLLRADIPRPDTLEQTLAHQLEAMEADQRVENPRIDYADKSITFGLNGLDGNVSYPDNLHRKLQSADSDAERQEILDSFVLGAVDAASAANTSASIDKSSILPVIRGDDFAQGLGDAPPVWQVLTGNLAVFLVQDRPTSLSYIAQADLDDLDLTFDEALALALKNQQARQWQPSIEGDGIYALFLDGTFEASLLLDTLMWDNIESQIGPVIATAPTRDLVIFGANDVPEVKNTLRELGQKYFATGSYTLSPQLMIRTAGGWQVVF